MFRRIEPPSFEGVLDEFRGGPVSVVVHGYLFGQYRIQCWYQARPAPALPEILSPVC